MDSGLLTFISDSLEVLVAKDIADGGALQQEFASAVGFKKALVEIGFSRDVEQTPQDFQPVISADNAAVFFSLKDRDLSILKRLRTLLKSVNMARLRGWLSLSSDMRESIPEIDILTEVLRLFGTFQRLIQLHKTFERLFSARPFQIPSGSLYGLLPRQEQLMLKFNHIWSDRHTGAMKGTGRIWVDRLLSEITVPNIARVQTRLIQYLPVLIDRESCTFKSVIPETEEILLQLKADVEKEVVRGSKDSFSIAFCGMVKAGCVMFFSSCNSER
jgi:hypothetical protein